MASSKAMVRSGTTTPPKINVRRRAVLYARALEGTSAAWRRDAVATDFRAVPDWLSWENQDTGIAVTDLEGNGQLDLIVLKVDAPVGKNEGYYRVGHSLLETGEVTGGWSDW